MSGKGNVQGYMSHTRDICTHLGLHVSIETKKSLKKKNRHFHHYCLTDKFASCHPTDTVKAQLFLLGYEDSEM